MRTDQVGAIVRREYLTRVRSKGFWIATILLPLAMGALVFIPSLVMMRTKAELRLTVVDAVGGLGDELARRLAQAPPPGDGADAKSKVEKGLDRDSETEIANI